MNIGDKVIIEGISRKGKNRVREHGNVWEVTQMNIKNFRLTSVSTKYIRWVDFIDDPDFKIKQIEK